MPSTVTPVAILWDVGGTLVDEAISGTDFMRRALRRLGIGPELLQQDAVRWAAEQFQQEMLTWRTAEDEREGFRRLAAGVLEGAAVPADGTTIDRLGQTLADYDEMYTPVPGVVQLLGELAALGLRQGVVSNWLPSLRRFLAFHALDRHLATIVNSAEEGLVKPDPGLLARALARLGVDGSAAVYVGDDPELDMRPAQRLGVPFIHFDPGMRHPGCQVREVEALRLILLERLAGGEQHSGSV